MIGLYRLDSNFLAFALLYMAWLVVRKGLGGQGEGWGQCRFANKSPRNLADKAVAVVADLLGAVCARLALPAPLPFIGPDSGRVVFVVVGVSIFCPRLTVSLWR